MTPCSCIGSQQNQEAPSCNGSGDNKLKAQVSIAQLIRFLPFMWIILKFAGNVFQGWNHQKGPVNMSPSDFVLWWVLAHFSKEKKYFEKKYSIKIPHFVKRLVKKKKKLLKITKNCHYFLIKYESALKSFLLSYFLYCQNLAKCTYYLWMMIACSSSFCQTHLRLQSDMVFLKIIKSKNLSYWQICEVNFVVSTISL